MSDIEDIVELDAIIALEKASQQSKGAALEENPYYLSELDESSEEDENSDNESEIKIQKKLNIILDNVIKVSSELTLPQINDEQVIIDNCTRIDLKKLLTLNRAKYNTLISMYNKIVALIEECHSKIAVEEKRLHEVFEVSKVTKESILSKLGYPYFKDSKMFKCPPNADTIIKQKNNEITLTYFLCNNYKHYWDTHDKHSLISAVKFYYANLQEKKILHEIKSIKTKYVENEIIIKNELDNQLMELQNQLEDYKTTKADEVPSLRDSNEIDWDKISAIYLDGKHSSSECKAYWNIFLHPSINKSPWSIEENKKILSLAKSYRYQDWDTIALQLKTNRTGFSTCVYYYTNLCDRFKKNQFTQAEDDFLLEVIAHCRVGDYIPWNKVANYFQDRSKLQLYHRYRYYLAENGHKGPFTMAEDILILCLMKKFGNLSKCARYIPNRSYIQIKSRYLNYLRNLSINIGNWTIDEDKHLMDYVKKAGTKKWGFLSRELTRTRSTVRQRYWTLLKWIKKNPEKPLEDMPRKKHPHLNKLRQRYSYLKILSEKFKNMDNIPTVQLINNNLQLRCNIKNRKLEVKCGKAVDAQLTEFFGNYCNVQKEKKPAFTSVQQSVDSINNILNALGADLDIPDKNELENCKRLDEIDVEILLALKHKMQKKEESNKKYTSFITMPSTSQSFSAPETRVKALLPPDYDSLIGLRGILLNHKKYKNQIVKSKFNRTVDAESSLIDLDKSTRERVEYEKKLYEYRFHSIFKWPSIVSLVEPNKLLKSNVLEGAKPKDVLLESSEAKDVPKRKVGRPPKKVNPKIIKMAELKRVKPILPAKTDSNVKKTKNKRVVNPSKYKNLPRKEGLRSRNKNNAESAKTSSNTIKDTGAVLKNMDVSFIVENCLDTIPEELIDIEKLNAVIAIENNLQNVNLKTYGKRKASDADNAQNKKMCIDDEIQNETNLNRSSEINGTSDEQNSCDSNLEHDIKMLSAVLSLT